MKAVHDMYKVGRVEFQLIQPGEMAQVKDKAKSADGSNSNRELEDGLTEGEGDDNNCAASRPAIDDEEEETEKPLASFDVSNFF